MKTHHLLEKLLLSLCLLSLLAPAVGNAAYVIHLRNGGKMATPQYWKEGQRVLFFVPAGVVGIEERMISRIETLADEAVQVREIRRPERRPPESRAEQAPVAAQTSPQKKPKQFDLKAAQEKMALLKGALNSTLARIRKATSDGDSGAREEATTENRQISAEMYRLTDEVKENNHDKLPAGWWAGIGKEETEPR